MTRLTAVIFVAVCWAVGGSNANADTLTFVCDYKNYSNEKGAHKAEADFRLTFVVDGEAKKSYLVGNNGSSEVTLIKNADGVSFLEVTDVGNVMVTTIADNMKTVHSRNGIISGDLIPSQYYGSCALK